MTNPYAAKGPESFWKQAIAVRAAAEICPIPAKRFRLDQHDAIATAGSCFAQNVAKHLKTRGGARFLEAETIAADQPSFSALYGNIYTVRQLVQLVEEALGERHPTDVAWRRPDGAFVDALRPTVFAKGFADATAVRAARVKHLSAVRALLSDCTVFIFTLGLTEAWRSSRDGTVYPLAPGVAAEPTNRPNFEFHNFGYDEVRDDVRRFVALMHRVNPTGQVLLTVSPVPLTATYTEEHVLVATTHSKAILRAVAGAAAAEYENVYYFPAYEIIIGNFSHGRYFENNLRTITPEGVAHVMRVFEMAYGLVDEAPNQAERERPLTRLFSEADENVICDEEEIVKSLGF
jgi:hypothetical protein